MMAEARDVPAATILPSCSRNRAVVHAARYSATISAAFSIVGAMLIIGTFLRWKDIRSHTRSILFFISIADFVTATGYLVGIAANYNIIAPDEIENYAQRHYGCQVQSWFTTTSSIVSFFWTDVMAISLLLSVVCQRLDRAIKLMPLFHAVCWLVPIILTTTGASLGYLGPDYSRDSVGWCWIVGECPSDAANATTTPPPRFCKDHSKSIYVWEFVLGKGWEVLSYFLVVVLCTIVRVYLSRERKLPSNIVQKETAIVAKEFERKMILVPVFFVLIRVWGTIRYFLNLTTHMCPAKSLDAIENVLLVLQGIGDPAQGWINCILYCFLTRKIRNRIWKTFACEEKRHGRKNTTGSDSTSQLSLPSSRSSSLCQESAESSWKGSSNPSNSLKLLASADDDIDGDEEPLIRPAPLPFVKNASYITGPISGETPP